MNRRDLLFTTLGVAAALPAGTRAQQPALPLIGFLSGASAAPFAHLVAAFRQGLGDSGFVEGQNVAIEYRWAENRYERLPEMASLLEQRADALAVINSAFFNSRREQLVALAARHRLPTIYEFREFALAGGLMSYGTHLGAMYRQMGVYTGRILKGAKPADMPILQPTQFELVINLKTAKALGLTLPQALLLRADEVIQ